VGYLTCGLQCHILSSSPSPQATVGGQVGSVVEAAHCGAAMEVNMPFRGEDSWEFIDAWGRKRYLDYDRYDDYGMAVVAARQAAEKNGGEAWRLRRYLSWNDSPWGRTYYTIEVLVHGEWKDLWNDGKLR